MHTDVDFENKNKQNLFYSFYRSFLCSFVIKDTSATALLLLPGQGMWSTAFARVCGPLLLPGCVVDFLMGHVVDCF